MFDLSTTELRFWLPQRLPTDADVFVLQLHLHSCCGNPEKSQPNNLMHLTQKIQVSSIPDSKWLGTTCTFTFIIYELGRLLKRNLIYISTLICAIRLTCAILSTFHTILNVDYHSSQNEYTVVFIVFFPPLLWLLYRWIKQSYRFLWSWFYSRSFCG